MFQFTQTVQLVGDGGDAERTPLPARVSNAQVAEVLFNIATLLEMQQANPYRIAAYRNAARGMLSLPEPAIDILARGEALAFPGLGDRLRAKISELITTGRMTFYDDLCEESLPEDVRALLAVRHIGPRIAMRLVGTLGIRTVEQLYDAARLHRLRQHYGFGERSERRLAESARSLIEDRRLAAQEARRQAQATVDEAGGYERELREIEETLSHPAVA
jgi:DNA polymerase/3'-5' exonuclease PolX